MTLTEAIYEYITIEEVKDTGKTKVWLVANKKNIAAQLGAIHWWSNWRQYVFTPEPGTIYSAGCLHDIRAFIYQQMEARK